MKYVLRNGKTRYLTNSLNDVDLKFHFKVKIIKNVENFTDF